MEWLAGATVVDVISVVSGRYGFFSASWASHLLQGEHGFCDDDSNTVLHLALAAEANPNVIRTLIASGARLDMENAFGTTPEDIIEQSHNVEYRVMLSEYQEAR